MKFIVYSEVTAARIATSMGLPEYSYYFVLRDFLPILYELGEVVVVERPAEEVDPLYDEACAKGQPCLFLSFSPPQKTLLDLRCPTIPVFAWEFYIIPNESWLDEPWQDWRYGFKHWGRGITHSQLIVDAVRSEMGSAFPMVAIPSPVWDKFVALRAQPGSLPLDRSALIRIRMGVVADTQDPALRPHIFGPESTARVEQAIRDYHSAKAGKPAEEPVVEEIVAAPAVREESYCQLTRRYLRQWYLKVLMPLLSGVFSARSVFLPTIDIVREDPEARPEPTNPVEPRRIKKSGLTLKMPEWVCGPSKLQLSGVVFTAMFNPYDGRKNWVDMLTAFCAAFRHTPDATLVFKLGHNEYLSAMHDMLIWMARMPPFQCRIVILHGYLEGAEFDELIRATAYTVNASHGEGQCLPLMEFMSCGKPAIAPRHSAMLDYIDEDVAFIVDSWLDGSAWSHDPRLAYRTLRHQIDWSSLRQAYLDAYACVREDPQRYQRMSAAAIARMQGHCSRAVAITRLSEFLDIQESQPE